MTKDSILNSYMKCTFTFSLKKTLLVWVDPDINVQVEGRVELNNLAQVATEDKRVSIISLDHFI